MQLIWAHYSAHQSPWDPRISFGIYGIYSVHWARSDAIEVSERHEVHGAAVKGLTAQEEGLQEPCRHDRARMSDVRLNVHRSGCPSRAECCQRISCSLSVGICMQSPNATGVEKAASILGEADY